MLRLAPAKRVSAIVERNNPDVWVDAFDAVHEQQQPIFVVTDLNTSPTWKINIGIGVGTTAATDH